MSSRSYRQRTYRQRSATALLPRSNNLSQSYRDKAMLLLGIPVAVFALPFAILNLVNGDYLLGLSTIAVIGQAAVNSWWVHKRRAPIVSPAVFFTTLLVCLVLIIYVNGSFATYWAYPMAMMVHFVARRRVARIVSAALLLIMLPVGIQLLGIGPGLRFGASLAMVLIFSAILVDMIIDLQNRLTELAVRDPLTGAFNRLQFDARLEEEAERVGRGSGPACLLALDIDNFKAVNDQHGHLVGDQVLIAVVEIMEKRLRKTDRVFRVGGEEFSIVLGNTDLKGATAFAHELRKRVAEEEFISNLKVTVSLGVTEFRAKEGVESWQRRADKLLYEAKRAGRNKVCIDPINSSQIDSAAASPKPPANPESD